MGNLSRGRPPLETFVSTTIISAIRAGRVVDPVTHRPVFIGPAFIQPVFALWEETYESNVWPKTPTWCMRYVGEPRGAMEFILKAAGVCEGGMLRWQKERRTQPESCIRRWRRALAAPVPFAPASVYLNFGESYMNLPAASLATVQAILEKYLPGADTHVDNLGRHIDLSKAAAWDAVCELTARHETGALPWRLFRSGPPDSTPDPALGIPKPKADGRRGDVTKRGGRLPLVFDLGAEEELGVADSSRVKEHRDHLALHHDGEVHIGWPYSLIGHFTASRVLRPELAEPGVAEPLIAAMREATVQAAPLPLEATLTIPRVEGTTGDWAGLAWDALANQVPPTCSVWAGGQKRLQVTVGELVSAGLLRAVLVMLRRLDDAKAWISWPCPLRGSAGTRPPTGTTLTTSVIQDTPAMV